MNAPLDVSAMARRAGAQGASALHHLRQRRRRQVDPDRAAALRHQADLRRPALRAGSGQQEAWHAGRRHRLRAAGRRAVGGARAGHHHRRRLPLLRQREAQVHRRRYAGARAVHAQHGHRRFDRRPRGAAGRCAQGRADPDAAALLPRAIARHPALRPGRDQDGPGRFRPGRVRRDRRRLSAVRGPDRDCELGPYPALGQGRRQCQRAQRAECPGSAGRPCSSISTPYRSMRRRMRRSRSACPCNGSTGPDQGFRGFTGQIASGSVVRSQDIRVLPSGRTTRIERIVTADGDLDEAVAGQSVTLTFADEIDCSRGNVIASAIDAPEVGGPVRGDNRLDGRAGDAPGPRLLAEARNADGDRHRPPPEIRSERQHARASGGEDARAERDRRRRGRDRPRDRLRALCGRRRLTQPGARRVHPDRQTDQRHRRRGHASFRVAPGDEHPPPAPRRQPRDARDAEGPDARRCCGSRA